MALCWQYWWTIRENNHSSRMVTIFCYQLICALDCSSNPYLFSVLWLNKCLYVQISVYPHSNFEVGLKSGMDEAFFSLKWTWPQSDHYNVCVNNSCLFISSWNIPWLCGIFQLAQQITRISTRNSLLTM